MKDTEAADGDDGEVDAEADDATRVPLEENDAGAIRYKLGRSCAEDR